MSKLTGWRFSFLVGGIIGMVALTLIPAAAIPIMKPEYYGNFHFINIA